MSPQVNKILFDNDEILKKKLLEVIENNKDKKGALIPILQQAQEIYGYLPIEVQKIIAEELNIPLEKIYGVVTFYSFFSLYPKGKYRISVCLGTACYVRGSGKVLDKIEELLQIEAGQCTKDRKFSLDTCRCVGACGLAPVMMVNDDVYGHVNPTMVEEILSKYK